MPRIVALLLLAMSMTAFADRKPNFVIVFTDDQGYGDLSCYGSPDIATPNIDRMAREGMRLTSFYAQTVCGPSRGAMMTGSYPMRLKGNGWFVDTSEVTMAEVLRDAGYRTACIGKWDMSRRQYIEGMVPSDQGFEYFYGALGANDGGRVGLWQDRNPQRVTDDMGELTGLYTDKAIAYMRAHHDVPFLLYLAHTMPHTKLGTSDAFRGKSRRGLYGDVIEEIDHHTGRLLQEIRDLGLEKDTYVIFTSDNGPWLVQQAHGGSALPLRNGKGSAWEGGFRVPTVVWGPGNVPAGVSNDSMMATMDLLPTFAALSGAKLPGDRTIDGVDQSRLIRGESETGARKDFYYYVGGNFQLDASGEPKQDNPWAMPRSVENLHAVRQGNWKLALPDRRRFWSFAPDAKPVNRPQLYDLAGDPGETRDMAEQHPEVVKRLLALADKARTEIGDLQQVGTQSRDAAK